MRDTRPNIVVVLGSQSEVLKPVVANWAQEYKVVRIYSTEVPDPLSNCLDTRSIREVPFLIDSVRTEVSSPRIAFVGAAFRRQKSLFADLDQSEIEAIIATNVSLYVEAVRVLLPIMLREKYGRFVYLSSFRATNPIRGTTLYSASKAFGETFISAIGKEYGRLGISTASIRMGYFESGMINDYSPEEKSQSKKSVSMNRFGTASDLESTINHVFENPYLNSGTLELNGGLNLG